MRTRNRPIQTNFTAGELSPRLRGRVDLQQYGDAYDQAYNFQILPGGGATRRPGSTYVVTCKDSTAAPRLIPFLVSNVVAYVMEFGAGYIRFMRNRGPVVDANGHPIELATPYASAELRAIRYAQSADVMYIAHVNHPPMKLQRVAVDMFTIAPVAFVDGPYDVENTGDAGAAAGTGATTNQGSSNLPRPSPGLQPSPPGTVIGGAPGDPGGDGTGGRPGGQYNVSVF